MLDTRNIYPLSDFQRNAKEFIAHLQESHKPIILTVNGKAAVVIQDAASYQALLDALEMEQSAAAIQLSIKEAAEGKDVDAKEGLQALRAKHGISS
ncbi:prevent-host-death protein [Leptolyngbya sp. 'hensonii']|uniref:type II toxin-antitoxin system Phd/YefM family antitoxin n=1 Tax=Leptolyngbya sp. 'hensonii' TaxID=1922337 RepID=UPI00094F5411|nr:type II toxin-antitoxin system Phd/YefM family antitoxin [Leptolyngbya sp. 'hensonii']OLP20345.1 prevent-host-death protein [Leptolyngbya sp. 'hensonii']